MRLGFLANPNKPKALELVEQALACTRDRVEAVLTDETAERLSGEWLHQPLGEMEVEVLVVIGGDGTFLSALQRSSAPILPVHAGTLGFLSEVDGDTPGALESALERLIRGQYSIEPRMKLASDLRGANLPDATNEVVIHTSQVSKMRLFEIAVDGHPVGRIRGDGIIAATPTGSTSYALSAQGPIVDPSVEAILVTALAPFRTAQRAVLVDPLRMVSVRLVEPNRPGVVAVDGQIEVPMNGGESVRIYRSARRAGFVRFEPRFFHQLRGKKILPWNEDDAESG